MPVTCEMGQAWGECADLCICASSWWQCQTYIQEGKMFYQLWPDQQTWRGMIVIDRQQEHYSYWSIYECFSFLLLLKDNRTNVLPVLFCYYVLQFYYVFTMFTVLLLLLCFAVLLKMRGFSVIVKICQNECFSYYCSRLPQCFFFLISLQKDVLFYLY